MRRPLKILALSLFMTVFIFPALLLSSQNAVFATDHEEKTGNEMKMNGDSGDEMKMNESTNGQMEKGGGQAMEKMEMGGTNSWQDQINKISYPITAIFALIAVWVCFLLMRATGMVDKFGLISLGLALFLVQAVFGVLFYLSNGSIVSMPTLMFVMSLLNSLALLLIGTAFYRWKRMIG